MRTRGMTRRIRRLAAVVMAAMLLSTLAGSAVAKGHDVTVDFPPSAGGWYSEPVSGAFLFDVAQPVPPYSAGEFVERIWAISCNALGGSVSFDEPSLPQNVDTSVAFHVTSQSTTWSGTVLTCIARYERDYAVCVPFVGCHFLGGYEWAGEETASTTIKADGTAPSLFAPWPSAPPNANGWYRTVGTVDWSGTDSLSGIRACSTDVPFGGTDALSAFVDGGCTDVAGNVRESRFTYKYDATPPVLTPTVQPSVIVLGEAATATANATDATSGVATQSCGPVDSSTVGTHSVSCTATDNAGNTTIASATYTVGYVFEGFSAPVDTSAVNVATAGKTIPLKWRVTNGSGAPITTLTSVGVLATGITCDLGDTADQLEAYATDAVGLRHLGDGYYQFNWKTPKSYASSCKVLHLDLGDGIDHTAEFRFAK